MFPSPSVEDWHMIISDKIFLLEKIQMEQAFLRFWIAMWIMIETVLEWRLSKRLLNLDGVPPRPQNTGFGEFIPELELDMPSIINRASKPVMTYKPKAKSQNSILFVYQLHLVLDIILSTFSHLIALIHFLRRPLRKKGKR